MTGYCPMSPCVPVTVPLCARRCGARVPAAGPGADVPAGQCGAALQGWCLGELARCHAVLSPSLPCGVTPCVCPCPAVSHCGVTPRCQPRVCPCPEVSPCVPVPALMCHPGVPAVSLSLPAVSSRSDADRALPGRRQDVAGAAVPGLRLRHRLPPSAPRLPRGLAGPAVPGAAGAPPARGHGTERGFVTGTPVVTLGWGRAVLQGHGGTWKPGTPGEGWGPWHPALLRAVLGKVPVPLAQKHLLLCWVRCVLDFLQSPLQP